MSTEVEGRKPFTFPFTEEEDAIHHIEHTHLYSILKTLPSDFEPWGNRPDDERGSDCSCGCVFYKTLQWPLGGDWGVCVNPKSPRCSLLTFEHQGCPEFTSDCADENCNEELSLAEYLRRGGQVLTYRCPKCGDKREAVKASDGDERCHKHSSKKKPYTQMVLVK